MIRPFARTDLPAVLALNNAHAVEVNALTADALAALIAVAAHARVVDGGLGFLIALSERTPPQGPNHAWFIARYPAFLYIDRVVVAPEAQGRGHARRMYEELAAMAGDRPLCCEVNLLPPNPGSLAFHGRLGFVAWLTQPKLSDAARSRAWPTQIHERAPTPPQRPEAEAAQPSVTGDHLQREASAKPPRAPDRCRRTERFALILLILAQAAAGDEMVSTGRIRRTRSGPSPCRRANAACVSPEAESARAIPRASSSLQRRAAGGCHSLAPCIPVAAISFMRHLYDALWGITMADGRWGQPGAYST